MVEEDSPDLISNGSSVSNSPTAENMDLYISMPMVETVGLHEGGRSSAPTRAEPRQITCLIATLFAWFPHARGSLHVLIYLTMKQIRLAAVSYLTSVKRL